MQTRHEEPRAKVDRRWRARTPDAEERRKQRWVLVVGLAVLLLVVAFPIYGFYRTYVQPPRVWAAQLDGEVVFTMGDLVKMMRVLQSASIAVGQQMDLSTAPFEVLFTMVQNELIRQAAPQYGIRVTQGDIEEGLRERFYPKPREGEDPPKEQLEREYQESYRRFLNQARLTDREYRQVVLLQLYRDRMREELGKRVPSAADQVEVMWIRLPSDFANAQAVVQRLRDGEDFAKVAREVGGYDYYADRDRPGYVGWVPRGAFPSLDPYLFGPDESAQASQRQARQLQPGEISDPISTQEGTYIVRVLQGPEFREIASERMRERLKDVALSQWLDEEWKRRQVQVNFNSEWYAWVADQVRRSVPPTQRTPAAGG